MHLFASKSLLVLIIGFRPNTKAYDQYSSNYFSMPHKSNEKLVTFN